MCNLRYFREKEARNFEQGCKQRQGMLLEE